MTLASRFLVLLFAIAQCAMPSLLSVVDGAASGNGRNAAAHFEDVSSTGCQPAHSAECGLCRFLSTASVKPVVDAPCPVAKTHGVSESGVATAGSSGFRWGFRSRAPPIA